MPVLDRAHWLSFLGAMAGVARTMASFVWLRSLGAGLLLLLIALVSRPCVAQTPMPLANWQYSAGEVLATYMGPVPDWRVVLGLGAMVAPDYPGAKRYMPEPAGIVDVRYKDIAFASIAEGIGVNLLHGKGYRAGIAVSYDFGRYRWEDPRLDHLPNIGPAAEPKIFAQYFLKPVVLAADLRKGIGGHNGVIGDLGAYVPLPITKTAFLFIGPTLGMANGTYMNAYFGIDPTHVRQPGLPTFAPRGGFYDTGIGATGVYMFGNHWLLSLDAAYQRLLGDAVESPLTETRTQLTADFIVGYRF